MNVIEQIRQNLNEVGARKDAALLHGWSVVSTVTHVRPQLHPEYGDTWRSVTSADVSVPGNYTPNDIIASVSLDEVDMDNVSVIEYRLERLA